MGQVAVESALVMPLMVVVCLGLRFLPNVLLFPRGLLISLLFPKGRVLKFNLNLGYGVPKGM